MKRGAVAPTSRWRKHLDASRLIVSGANLQVLLENVGISPIIGT